MSRSPRFDLNTTVSPEWGSSPSAFWTVAASPSCPPTEVHWPQGDHDRQKALDGLEAWLEERFQRHAGNADVVRQELWAEKGIRVSLRTVERAVAHLRQELRAEVRATVRFGTQPSQQLQIDFG